MCTAISLKLNKHYFGRTLDLEYHYNESVIITPRNFTFHFRYNKPINTHYLIFGIGIIENNYPLYYDACNECGLSIAGLNLPHSTTYSSYVGSKVNITSFELIPYILSNCTNIKETIDILNNCNPIGIPIIVMQQIHPIINEQIDHHSPPNINHNIFPNNFIISPPWIIKLYNIFIKKSKKGVEINLLLDV